MEKEVKFDSIFKLKDVASQFSEVEGSYIFTHIKPGYEGPIPLDLTPMKLNSMFIFLVLSDTPFDVEINLQQYTLRKGTFVALFPGNVIRLLEHTPADIESYLLSFDMNFLQNVNINMTAVSIPPLIGRPIQVMDLNDDESNILSKYMELLRINTQDTSNPVISRNIATSIIAALFYQIVQFFHRRLSGYISNDGTAKAMGRRHDYVREFIKMVHLHYIKERSVSFYADRLYISPKYLSLLVKEATGRSAAKWIDDFVLMEAKNMLRFSNRNIQQVAYALNFPTQSSFGKYFKHLTGMSPTEYQKS